MSPKKLTETDKKQILELYRLPEETTSTLANRYSVSSSTISRFLKSTLNESEYEDLIQQKRLSRTAKPTKTKAKDHNQLPISSDQSLLVDSVEDAPEDAAESDTIIKKIAAPSKTVQSSSSPSPIIKKTNHSELALEFEQENDFYDDEEEAEFIALEEMLGEDIADDDEDDEEDDEWEDDAKEEEYHLVYSETFGINILPLSEAPVLRTCYLVIDRGAELITKPLKDFGDLGTIPPEEIQQKTLPIFENHRVAKRFSNRSQRVIKVPDGRILQKTGNYLQAKGITRLLIDGKVYSLSS